MDPQCRLRMQNENSWTVDTFAEIEAEANKPAVVLDVYVRESLINWNIDF